jgi:hypothetical protein
MCLIALKKPVEKITTINEFIKLNNENYYCLTEIFQKINLLSFLKYNLISYTDLMLSPRAVISVLTLISRAIDIICARTVRNKAIKTPMFYSINCCYFNIKNKKLFFFQLHTARTSKIIFYISINKPIIMSIRKKSKKKR